MELQRFDHPEHQLVTVAPHPLLVQLLRDLKLSGIRVAAKALKSHVESVRGKFLTERLGSCHLLEYFDSFWTRDITQYEST